MPSPRKSSNNLRSAAYIGGSLVVVAVLALVLVNLAGSGGKAEKPKHVANSVGLVLQIGPVDVQSAGPPARINSSVKQSVLDSSQSYVDDAILAPLEKGRLGQAYAQIFDRGVRRAAIQTATLTEVRTGSLKAPLKATATKVRLTAWATRLGIGACRHLRGKRQTPRARAVR